MITALVGVHAVTHFATPQVPPHVVDVLSNGTAYLDVPVMALYTAPVLNLPGFASNMSFAARTSAQGPSTYLTFQWGGVRGTNESVRFVLEAGPNPTAGDDFVAGPTDGLRLFPAGPCAGACVNTTLTMGESSAGQQSVYRDVLRMDYSVVRMAATVGSVAQSWLQVNDSLTPEAIRIGDPLPTVNTTAPLPADLLPDGERVTYHLSRDSTVSILASIYDFHLSAASFRHALPPVLFDGGTAGTFTASLTSEFAWNSAGGYWLGWSAGPGAPGNVTPQYYVDQRFGSLLVEFVS